MVEQARESLALYTMVWATLLLTILIESIIIVNGLVSRPEVFAMGVAIFQATLIAVFYMHLKDEPMSIKAMSFTAILLLIVLISAAITSVIPAP